MPKVTKEDLIAEFPTVFDGQIRTMPGEKFKIVLTDDAKPFCIHTPRTIPFPFREKLKELLDALLEAGIIAPQTEPTDWCAPIGISSISEARYDRQDGARIVREGASS